jgi:hypothetical protein
MRYEVALGGSAGRRKPYRFGVSHVWPSLEASAMFVSTFTTTIQQTARSSMASRLCWSHWTIV